MHNPRSSSLSNIMKCPDVGSWNRLQVLIVVFRQVPGPPSASGFQAMLVTVNWGLRTLLMCTGNKLKLMMVRLQTVYGLNRNTTGLSNPWIRDYSRRQRVTAQSTGHCIFNLEFRWPATLRGIIQWNSKCYLFQNIQYNVYIFSTL